MFSLFSHLCYIPDLFYNDLVECVCIYHQNFGRNYFEYVILLQKYCYLYTSQRRKPFLIFQAQKIAVIYSNTTQNTLKDLEMENAFRLINIVHNY